MPPDVVNIEPVQVLLNASFINKHTDDAKIIGK